MALDIIATLVAGVLLAAAVFGTVYPIVPGSPLALVALLGWGWAAGSTVAWVAAGIGAVLTLAGWSASAVLTGRRLKKQEIPKRSIAVAVVAGVVGMFVIPVAGLFLGFAAGLFLSEYLRRKDAAAAGRSSFATLKAMGLGMLLEFMLVALAGSVWTIGVIVHFVTA